MVKSSCPCNNRSANINDRCIVGMSNDPKDPDPYFYPQTCRGQKLTFIQEQIDRYAGLLDEWQVHMKNCIQGSDDNSELLVLQTEVDAQTSIITVTEKNIRDEMERKGSLWEKNCLAYQNEIYAAKDEKARQRRSIKACVEKSADKELQLAQVQIDTCIQTMKKLQHDYIKRKAYLDQERIPVKEHNIGTKGLTYF